MFSAASLLFFLIIEWPYGGQGVAMRLYILETRHTPVRGQEGDKRGTRDVVQYKD